MYNVDVNRKHCFCIGFHVPLVKVQMKPKVKTLVQSQSLMISTNSYTSHTFVNIFIVRCVILDSSATALYGELLTGMDSFVP